jgi:hypothetical protein
MSRMQARWNSFRKHLHNSLLEKCNFVIAPIIAQYALEDQDLLKALSVGNADSLEVRSIRFDTARWIIRNVLRWPDYRHATDAVKARFIALACHEIFLDEAKSLARALNVSPDNQLLISSDDYDLLTAHISAIDSKLITTRRAWLQSILRVYSPPAPGNFIPLRFFFNNDPGLAIPFVGIGGQALNLRIKEVKRDRSQFSADAMRFLR